MHTVVCVFVEYFILLLTVRILSRRPGAQLTPFEFVIVFLVGGVVILATVGDDRSMTNCFCGIIAVALLHRTVADLRLRFPRFGAFVDGTPLVLIDQGKWQDETMNRMRLQDVDVMASARTKGIKSLEEIEYAVLERNGAISVIKRKEN